jgi:taurine--2-oxoglutarate transaminase
MAVTDTNRVKVDDAKYVLHSWSVRSAIDPIPIAGAEGRYFWDFDGKRYLDFASQLVNVSLGHQHPKVIAAIKEQADRLTTIGPMMANEQRSELARLLDEVTPGDLTMSFFTNGGAEANENAIKLARWYTGRHKIVTRYRSYHGATAGAISATGDPRRWPAEPGLPGIVRMLDPYTYRCPAGHPDPCPVCTGAPHLEEILQYEGPQNVAAVLLETITGTNGVIPPPPGCLQAVREVCDRHGILLIADEVMAGFGRTGRWFAIDHWNVVPDLICMAKGLTSAYVQLGAVGMRSHIAKHFQEKVFYGGLTYNSHPLGCATALATIAVYEEDGLIERAKRTGKIMAQLMTDLATRHPSVGAVRSIGLFGVIELIRNRATKQPMAPFNGAAPEMAALAKFFRQEGLFTIVRWNYFFTNPPLIITEDQLREAFGIIDRGLEITDKAVT